MATPRDLRLSALRGHKVEPEHLSQIGFPRPVHSKELKDLAYGGHSVVVALHLAGEGLDDLEDIERGLIEREVEFALVEANSTSLDLSETSGNVEIGWEWPKAQFVNGAVVSVMAFKQPDRSGQPPDSMGEPITDWIKRDPDELERCIRLTLGDYYVDYELRFRFWLAIRSPSSGRYYQGHEEQHAVVPIAAMPQATEVREASSGAAYLRESPDLVFVDPHKQKTAWYRRFSVRVVLVAVGAASLLGLVFAMVWTLVT